MTARRYDPEIAPIVPTLPVENDWSDLPAARAAMEKMILSIPGEENAPDAGVRIADVAQAGDGLGAARPPTSRVRRSRRGCRSAIRTRTRDAG